MLFYTPYTIHHTKHMYIYCCRSALRNVVTYGRVTGFTCIRYKIKAVVVAGFTNWIRVPINILALHVQMAASSRVLPVVPMCPSITVVSCKLVN